MWKSMLNFLWHSLDLRSSKWEQFFKRQWRFTSICRFSATKPTRKIVRENNDNVSILDEIFATIVVTVFGKMKSSSFSEQSVKKTQILTLSIGGNFTSINFQPYLSLFVMSLQCNPPQLQMNRGCRISEILFWTTGVCSKIIFYPPVRVFDRGKYCWYNLYSFMFFKDCQDW